MFKKTRLRVHDPFLVCILFQLDHQPSSQMLMNFSGKVKILRWRQQVRGLGNKNSEINQGRLLGGGASDSS